MITSINHLLWNLLYDDIIKLEKYTRRGLFIKDMDKVRYKKNICIISNKAEKEIYNR